MEEKCCNKCLITKSLLLFHIDNNSKDLHRNTCKDCSLSISKKYIMIMSLKNSRPVQMIVNCKKCKIRKIASRSQKNTYKSVEL